MNVHVQCIEGILERAGNVKEKEARKMLGIHRAWPVGGMSRLRPLGAWWLEMEYAEFESMSRLGFKHASDCGSPTG